MNKQEIIRKAMSELGKLSHKKHPRNKAHFSAMGKKGSAKRWGKKKLSTPQEIASL